MPPSVTCRRASPARFPTALLFVLLTSGAVGAQAPDLAWMRGGQAGGSNGAYWAPDGATFAIAGDDGTVKVFDGASRLLLRTIRVNDPFFSGGVFDVTYAPDGARVATADFDNRVGVWDVSTGEEVWSADVGTWAYGIAFSPDGALLAFGRGNGVQVRNAGTGALVRTLAHGSEVIHTAFSADGARLAVGLYDRTIRIWRTSDWTTERTLTAGLRFPEVAFSPDGSMLAAAGEFENFATIRGEIRLWDVATGQHLRTMPMGTHISNARYVGFSPDGQLVFAGHEYDGVKIFRTDTGALVRHVPDVMSIRLAPDAQTFIGQPVGCGDWPPRWAAFSFPQGELLDEFMTHTSTVHDLDVSDDGGMVATGAFYFDSAVRVWDAQTAARRHEFVYTCNSDGLSSVAFSPDGSLVAGGGGDWDAEIRIWDRETGQLVLPLNFGHNHSIQAMAFSPDGGRIASGSTDPNTYIVSIPGGILLHAVPTGAVHDLAYSSDGALLAAGTWSSSIRIINAGTGAVVRTIPGAHTGGVRRVAFTPDGARLVSAGDDGRVKVWDVADGALVRTIEAHPGPVKALALSPDGRHVVSGGAGPAQLWELATGALLHTYDAETARMTDAEFLPGAAAFAFSREDATVGVARNPAAQAAVAVSAQPVSPPVVIPPQGGRFTYRVTLTNTTAQPQTVQAWTAVTGPVSREPVVGPQTVTLPPGASVVRTLTQRVPGNAPAGTYTYHVRLGTFPAPVTASDSFSFTKQAGVAPRAGDGAEGWAASGSLSEGTPAAASATLPEGFALSAAHPNPFTRQTTLTLEVAAAQAVRAEVYDGLGRRVAVLADGAVEAGVHALVFDASALPSGVYVVRVAGEAFAATRRLTLVK